ncbi:MAG: cyanophycinase [Bacteroidales bacterium]|nr:cyanophycinase [Bacteroidales bacterium]
MLKNFSLFLTERKHKRGTLVLIGGAEDRQNKKMILNELIRRTQPERMAVIPAASSYGYSLGRDYQDIFIDLGVPHVAVLDMKDPVDAEQSSYINELLNTNLVFFTGGDQVRLFNIIGNTSVHRIIKNRFFNDGLHVAGTSAGAAVMSNPMIYDGNQLGLVKGRVQFAEGLGLVNFTVDTHFISRGRLGRLTQFLCTGISQFGIGIGEDTALFIHPDQIAEVIGSGMITVVRTNHLTYNNYHQIPDNTPITIDGIQVGFLQHGTTFNLQTWTVVKAEPVTLDPQLIEELEQ